MHLATSESELCMTLFIFITRRSTFTLYRAKTYYETQSGVQRTT